jgi:predicted RNA binding protein YcfA (HicA-like mRNA interferase family)
MVMQRSSDGETTTIPVPDHPELRTGTLRSIIRQSGLEIVAFRR